jgi:subtilase family serine protease
MLFRRRRVLALVVALVAVPAASPAGATVLRPPRLPAGARELGAVARTATVRATVALAPRDAAGLSAYARSVSTPGSLLYHRYLTVGQFARRFAPPAGQVAAVRRSLRRAGVVAGRLAANGLELSVTGPAGRVQTAFATRLRRFALAGGRTGFATTAEPAADPSVAGLVQGVIGLDTLAPSAPRVLASRAAGSQDCGAARAQASGDGSYTTSQIATRYHLDSLYAAGVLGRGVTVAVYELEPFDASDVAAFQSCSHSAASVNVVSVDGGAGSGAGSGEAAMDVEDVIGMAPDANVRVYEGPSTGAGAYDTYARIVSDDTARVLTTSWGLCESYEGAGAAAAESTLFQEAAVQGQSVFASSGDTGSDDCGNRRPAVDDPASQPWVTGVGATTVGASGETAWNDGYGATGGGVSSLWARPSYQASAAEPQGSVTCGSAGTSCREVPDVTADGDPESGYVIYWHGRWNTMGGTSISTPTWAALAVLADSSAGCQGRPAGFVNPILYRLAAASYAANFGDVTGGANGYDEVAGFAAAPGYDMASGLGVPDAAALVPAMCGEAPLTATTATVASTGSIRLSRIGARASVLGAQVRWRVRVSDRSGAAVRFAAAGLPAGVRIGVRTGLVTGRPSRAGRFTVTVRATDSGGAQASVHFRWLIRRRSSRHSSRRRSPR